MTSRVSVRKVWMIQGRQRLRRPCGRVARRRDCAMAASSSPGGGDDKAGSMDLESAREMFGVPTGASFDEVLRAKKKLRANSDHEQETIDAAYDVLLMDSLRNRQEGKGVSKDVRYADVPKAKPVAQVANELLQKLPGNVQVQVGSRGSRSRGEEESSLPLEALNAQNVTFGLISLWVLAQAVSSPVSYAYDNPGSQIAAAVIASLYFQRQEKGQSIGRAAAITFGGLLIGTLAGSGVEALVRVDISPFLGFHSPAMVVGEFSVVGVWLACAFLL
ncbi:protein CHAPERONE-LIKE PROTEIN OF POR1-like [Chloropicon primus]|uniref:Uncharacterized protein n=1 Tax=Chloropicon primus TaxID=1764295 RepID=A0A5B8MUM2_9CHLO|nr:hypothetical protein A3770_10p58530 [Chloropicon primus]UPR02547.1 protein CHAPERONE-LIKE PROTEIN OF POR1-like [Chloropicon primus]|mmetsp:Transcript_119/g.283  ORF Transcript_119/g.283 Transcript_119/m.283 type:complete len:275 (-) Transcript_119:139-963(-)|eukprot:QDZ23335.1 hypothetical protein A3770_10p58530 [Chloropicon primus]